VLPLLLLLAAPPQLEDSVVKIMVYSARYDWTAPWRVLPVERSAGTGFLIDGGRIITNAHVVRDAKQVLVKRHQLADPFVARVEAVGHDCDLALLRVDDPAFSKGVKTLPIGALPEPRSQVTTYGYPAGGQELSSTTGIVSRVEVQTYVHSEADSHLAVQTDAAINPGNSGGPVIQNGKVVGVAFQGASQLQNTGYFIPSMILRHFLDDLKDGKYDGFPDSGIESTPLLSAAYRKERGLPDAMTGVVVDLVSPGSTADGVIKKGDVILAVEGQTVDNEGMVKLGSSRVPYNNPIDLAQVGAKTKFTIWRDQKKVDVEGLVRRIERWDLKRNRYGQQPKFVVYAGLVFMIVERSFLKTYGDGWPWLMPREMAHAYFFAESEDPARADVEPVALARVMRDPVNSQLAFTSGLLDKIDGKPVKGLADAAQLIDAARSRKSGFVIFDFADGDREVLDLAEAELAHARILETYGIPNDRNL
jgi:S1-C subfamily serine protease